MTCTNAKIAANYRKVCNNSGRQLMLLIPRELAAASQDGVDVNGASVLKMQQISSDGIAAPEVAPFNFSIDAYEDTNVLLLGTHHHIPPELIYTTYRAMIKDMGPTIDDLYTRKEQELRINDLVNKVVRLYSVRLCG